MEFGGLPHETIMTSIELLGTKVIPKLEKKARSFAAGRFRTGRSHRGRARDQRRKWMARWINPAPPRWQFRR